MGNTGSSSARGHHDETVDYGHLSPQGVYTGPQDWNHAIVTQSIVDRKLAPFYRPLEDYNDDWDDEQILAARRVLPDSDSGHSDPPATRVDSRDSAKPANPPKRSANLKEPSRCPEASLYRGAVECPICFLYYPSNINHSRCCDQAICTECFVQIKRTEPTTTHIVSEPAACPYCVQENFGVVYTPPSWRAGIGSEGMTPPSWADSPRGPQQNISGPSAAQKRRRKSFGHNSPEVVTTDQIRPDWEAKLAAVRAAVNRRANRRIIMRQVGDRLIPVGVTSGRVHALPTGDGAEGAEGESGSISGSRRRRGQRSGGQTDISQLLGQMGLGGQDLEELMVMEAMRLSLLEHEEQQRKEEEKKRKEAASGQITEGEASAEGSETAVQSSEAATPPLAQLGTGASSATHSSRSSQGGNPSDGALARSRSLTPVSGQTTASSQLRTPVDNLHDVSHSVQRSQVTSSEPTHMTETPASTGNGEAHVDQSSSNDEESRALLGGVSTQSPSGLPKVAAEFTMTPGAVSTSSIFDTDTPEPSSYNILPSSSDSSMTEPLVHPKHQSSGEAEPTL
ncbi:hypothetical protein HYDPIDRAFT_24190 [Hydnomerulius pinastri MD-312]|nr:hypothetical protein HYDPIDRAFT_24190 [Hydnomerulius pinastri MD-312]